MRLPFYKRALIGVVSGAVALAMGAGGVGAGVTLFAQAPPPPAQAGPPPGQGAPPADAADQPAPAKLSAKQLQDLVAPIALYPDALVAQILAASAYPTQIVEANRFLTQNPNLKGQELGAAVDKQDWDPSVKALTQFPTVLADMDKNLSWTSTLGDANYNQGADVMAAVQHMRHEAEKAGNLKTTQQQTVENQGPDVVIQPADPNVVYVPDYDPELIYGYPVGLWPGFYPWWGVGGPYLSFGIGFGISPFFGYGWGWGGWGLNWRHGGLFYGGRPYGFQSHAFYDRNAYFHGNYRGFAPYGAGDRGARGFSPAGRGNAPIARGNEGARSGAFGGITRGGEARGYSSRGANSFGGGARAGGGGGGFHGGGGGGGARGGGGGGRR